MGKVLKSIKPETGFAVLPAAQRRAATVSQAEKYGAANHNFGPIKRALFAYFSLLA